MPEEITVGELQDAYVSAKKERQHAEHERLRVQNDLHWEAFQSSSMIVVPLPKDKSVSILDSATGDGYWMQQESRNHPNALFTGIDVDRDYFEALGGLSASISFKVQSLLMEWPKDDHDAYDLVHQRYALTNMPRNEASMVIKRLMGLVKPGGYIQLVEADMMAFDREGHPGMSALMDFMANFFATGDMDPSTGPKLAGWLEQAGAEDIESKVMSFGIGARGRSKEQQEKSTWNELTLVNNLRFVCEKIPGFWYSADRFQALERLVREEMETTGNTWRFYVVTGRRPLAKA
ncbi:methyltransferase GliN [Lophiostoma macrostomum CBS 122681]|uniref:Methyltransferase GliN n=1 Tax=Lophiostoma macrostomum CBS 122681 TaxID=1314788 RepID=A0A6A6TBC5_9PLEO|nr:methyltransferase GliN [Lophiostoma macrostomum CBS 122681]